MEGTVQHRQHTTTTTSGVGVGSGRRSEQKEPLTEVVGEQAQQLFKKVEHIGDEVCQNWRQYPKVITVILMLSCLLFGAGITALIHKGTGNYISSHWDRQTADAHHALDVVLDHLKNPNIYQSEQGWGILKKSRGIVGNFLQGVLPKSWEQKIRGEGHENDWSVGGVGSGSGRRITDDIYEKVHDKVSDLKYGARSAVDKVGDVAKDAGYGIGHTISEFADTVKNKFTGSSDHDDDFLGSRRGNSNQRGGNQRFMDGDEDDMRAAKEKLNRVVRQADREY